MNIFRLILIGVLLLTVTGCNDSEEPETQSQPVIEAYISADGFPTVFFTTSVVPGLDGSIQDNVVTAGRVSISDGEKEVVMTASKKSGYVPPFRYYTFDMRGEAGKTYTVTATYKGMKAVARCKMPVPTPIDSIVLTKTSNDTLRAATLFFTAPEDTPAYYYLTMRSETNNGQPLPCMLGTIKVTTPGEKVTMPVMRPRQKIDGEDYVSQLKVGEIVEIQLNRITEDVYDFWRAYDNMVDFSTSPFITSDQSLPGNVEGGLGIFSAQGQSTHLVEVK